MGLFLIVHAEGGSSGSRSRAGGGRAVGGVGRAFAQVRVGNRIRKQEFPELDRQAREFFDEFKQALGGTARWAQMKQTDPEYLEALLAVREARRRRGIFE